MSYKKASDKWMAIAEGRDVDKRNENCPLCLEFYSPTRGCAECPIYKDTGKDNCSQTPWSKWVIHHFSIKEHDFRFGMAIECYECQRLALNEWLYLKSIGE